MKLLDNSILIHLRNNLLYRKIRKNKNKKIYHL